MLKKINKIAVFCGAKLGIKSDYSAAAKALANAFAEANITLVYGGAKVGLMGVIADQMLKLQGQVIGVMPEILHEKEVTHPDLTELHIVSSMHERKVLISKLADAFIMLPGGPGSLDEFFEMFALMQIGFHNKLCGILNTENYYDNLIHFLDHAVAQGFLMPMHRKAIIIEKEPERLLKLFLLENIEANVMNL